MGSISPAEIGALGPTLPTTSGQTHQACPLALPVDCAVREGNAITGIGSAFEGNKAAESRIREAVLSGFDVTGESIFESRVCSNRDD